MQHKPGDTVGFMSAADQISPEDTVSIINNDFKHYYDTRAVFICILNAFDNDKPRYKELLRKLQSNVDFQDKRYLFAITETMR